MTATRNMQKEEFNDHRQHQNPDRPHLGLILVWRHLEIAGSN